MNHHLLLILAIALLSTLPQVSTPPTVPGLRVPDGFEVSEYAGSELANDIYTITVDPKGRIVTAGRGYIRILADDDGDGRADRAIPFADVPKDGAMGMLWEGDTLYVTGDGGLRRFRDANGDDRADGPPELIRTMKTGGEHEAHAIRRGPDGWLYVLCGNHTGIDSTFAELATSPITQPIAGAVLRFTPDLKKSEIIAHGFRNAYDMDFNVDGELFTYDSDNERCVSLPWYEPTRFYHVVPGGFYGWLSPQYGQFWRCPPYFADVMAPVATLGRGSPTGVACYRHVQFPEKYRGGMFALDWTFGRIYFLKLERAGATYTADKEIFMEATGDSGFAPTGIVVHPQSGDLFISIGGRGTRGAVYRVRYTKAAKTVDEASVHALQPRKRSLKSADWQAKLRKPEKDLASNDALQRLHFLQAFMRHYDDVPSYTLERALALAADDPDPLVRRTGALFLQQLPRDMVADVSRLHGVNAKQKPGTKPRLMLAMGLVDSYPAQAAKMAADILREPCDTWDKIAAVRVMQLALGDLVSRKASGTVFEGYTPRLSASAMAERVGPDLLKGCLAAVRSTFPSNALVLDRELSRLLAVLEDDDADTRDKVVGMLQQLDDPVEKIHYLIVLARLRAPWNQRTTIVVADVLLDLDRELETRKLNRDRHWPLRIAELYSALARHDSRLHDVLVQHKEFGRPDHALFALAEGFNRQNAARRFLKRAEADDRFTWNAPLVKLVAALPPEECFPALRRLWGQAGLDAEILSVLALHPQPEDRSRFVQGLRSPDVAVVTKSLSALKQLPARLGRDEVLAVLTAWFRLPHDQAKPLQTNLVDYLQCITGARHGQDRSAWLRWFADRYPQLAERLANPDGIDVAAWQKRLAQLRWENGNTSAGEVVYRKIGCIACHGTALAMGPDLRGVTSRFSRSDLFTAIIQPSKDVSPRYQSTQIETRAGKVYQGLIIYQATDGVILQTGAVETVRIAGDEIADQRQIATSLMPPGLLDRLSDQEIVDLYAYLQQLR